MGLMKAALGAAGGVMADQWKEYFYCESIPENVMAVKGLHRVSGRSSNYKGSENIISNGSVIAVADGQCMIIVDQGKVTELCAEPGEFVYDSSTEPSIFSGELGTSILDTFKNIGKRFTFGGEPPKDQRVYYFNTKELIGNKYGTPSPVPFRVVDQRAGIDIDIAIRCFGEYSYRICDPILFYTNVCGNVGEDYTRDRLDGQLKTELLTALQPAFAKISDMGIRYSALPGHTMELADALNEVLSGKWRNLRGLEIVSFGVSSVKASEEDEQMLKEMQRNAAFMDPTRAAAHLVGAQAAGRAAADKAASAAISARTAAAKSRNPSRQQEAGNARSAARRQAESSARNAAQRNLKLRQTTHGPAPAARSTRASSAPSAEDPSPPPRAIISATNAVGSLLTRRTPRSSARSAAIPLTTPTRPDANPDFQKSEKRDAMPTQVTNYQCPACTGPLHFVGSSGKLECDYCGSKYDVAEIEALYAEKEQKAADAQKAAEEKNAQTASTDTGWDTSGLSGDWGQDAAGMKSYSCPSCGAELICDASTAATACPYCGNPSVVPGQFTGSLKPDFVLPFKLSKDDAVKALKAHYKGKPFLPRAFTAENHVQEIKGVYVPFWMFDGEAEGSAQYEATRSRSFTSGDYEVTETDHFDVYREGSLAFSRVPVDASSKMPDDYMDSIEPFDYDDLKPFSTAYLPGFLADKYDVSVEDSAVRADTRCEGSLVSALARSATGYDSCVPVSQDVKLHRGKVHYALLPVWTLHTKWNGKDYLFAMNGQTGKLVGDLPTSYGKFWGTFAAIAAGLTAVLSAVYLFLT